MIYLADKQAKINPEKPIMVREIAEAYSIPAQFLAKITQTLAKHHLLNTTRGRGGESNCPGQLQPYFYRKSYTP